MKPEVLAELYEPFKLKSRQGLGGKTFQYAPSEDVIHRMNTVFGGNWSTEVTLEKVVEEQVLMSVRVTVYDPDTESWYSQEGFASHPISRYTKGENTGKIIDIGNVYRSAMSKAIKTACAKWGVGLYLDGSHRVGVAAGKKEAIPTPPDKDSTPPVTVNVPGEIPTAGAAGNSTPFPIPTEVPPTAAPPANTPPITNVPADVTAPVVTEAQPATYDTPPVFTNENVVTNTSNTNNFQPASGGNEMVTPVQKVAIQANMDFNKMEFTELASKALKRTDDLPDIDHLTYDEAVAIIQYCNRLKSGK